MNAGLSNKGEFVISVDKIDKENFVLSILELKSFAVVEKKFKIFINISFLRNTKQICSNISENSGL